MCVLLTAGFNGKLFNCNFLRIIPISRPVILSELLLKVKTAYGQELSMNYVSDEVNLVNTEIKMYFVLWKSFKYNHFWLIWLTCLNRMLFQLQLNHTILNSQGKQKVVGNRRSLE